jgi:hypothetical protein
MVLGLLQMQGPLPMVLAATRTWTYAVVYSRFFAERVSVCEPFTDENRAPLKSLVSPKVFTLRSSVPCSSWSFG